MIRRLLAATVLVVLVAGCRVETQVGIDVKGDGSGVVSVGVGLDDEALEAFPDIEQQLRIDDLRDAGWTVSGLEEEGDGLHWFRARKPFGTPEEAGEILAEVAGEDGPFQDFRVSRDESLLRREFDFEGTVDFAEGLEAFGDDALAGALEGEPLGEDVAAIEERLGRSIDEVFGFRVAVRLPGDVESNAPTTADNGAVWQPRVSEGGPITLTASSSSLRLQSIVLAAVAVVAAGLALVLLARGVVRWRRKRRPSPPEPRGRHAAA